jgi:transcriptional regulator with XRE-family HTH domain
MIAEPILSQKIMHYRKLHDMTQKELATIIGVDAVHIANIEKGRKGISLDKLVLLCRRFNIELSDILPIGEQNDDELRSEWINEIIDAIHTLDTQQLGLVKKMVRSISTE